MQKGSNYHVRRMIDMAYAAAEVEELLSQGYIPHYIITVEASRS